MITQNEWDSPDYRQEKLGDDEAQEYARLLLAHEMNVAITGLSGAQALEYIELTPQQQCRLAYLERAAWFDYIDLPAFYKNEVERADQLARAAGYPNPDKMAEALKRHNRSVTARLAAQIRQINRIAQAKQNRIKRQAQEYPHIRMSKIAEGKINTDHESAPATPQKIDIVIKPTIKAGTTETPNGWVATYTHEASGQIYAETYCRVVIAQMKLARAFEATNDDWWGNDTTITDTAIAIWEDRLARATTKPGSEEEREYHLRRAAVASSINKDYPDLAATVRSMVAARETPAAIILWFVGTRWTKELTVQALIMLIDRIWE